MNKIQVLLLAMLFTTLSLSAHEPIIYEDVVQVDSISSMELLYDRGYQWIMSGLFGTYPIKVADKENGLIVFNDSFNYNQKKWIWGGSELSKGYIHYTFKLFFKDGRFKYQITDFIHEPKDIRNSFGLITEEEEFSGKLLPGTARKWRKNIWNDIKERIEERASTMEGLLIFSIKNPSDLETDIDSQQNSDW